MSRKITLLARKLFDFNDRRRINRQCYDRSDIVSILNISYKNKYSSVHLLDIFRAKEDRSHKPLLINIHGGGLFAGYKEINTAFCDEFVRRGFDVVNLNYRRIPDVTLEEQIADIMEALYFIEVNADTYSLNIENTFIVGDSAGALLTYIILAIHFNEKHQKAFQHRPSKLSIKSAGLISIMLDTQRSDFIRFINDVITSKATKKAVKGYLTNPVSLIKNSAFPPLFLVTSQEDLIRKDTLKLAKYLSREKLTYQLYDLPKGVGHKLDHVFAVKFPKYDESQKMIDVMADYLKQFKSE